MSAFATVEELQAFWKTLTTDEQSRATTLLEYSSNSLRMIGRNNQINIDTEITNDPTGVYEDTVKLVVLSSVQRALATPLDAPPADSWSQSASPYSESMNLINPSTNLYFKSAELNSIGLSSVAGSAKFGVLRGVRGKIFDTDDSGDES